MFDWNSAYLKKIFHTTYPMWYQGAFSIYHLEAFQRKKCSASLFTAKSGTDTYRGEQKLLMR